MSTMEMVNKVNQIKELEQMVKEFNAEIEGLKDSIKREMETTGTEEYKTELFTVRYKEVSSSRFDSTAFKKAHGDLYGEFQKVTVSKRFTIS